MPKHLPNSTLGSPIWASHFPPQLHLWLRWPLRVSGVRAQATEAHLISRAGDFFHRLRARRGLWDHPVQPLILSTNRGWGSRSDQSIFLRQTLERWDKTHWRSGGRALSLQCRILVLWHSRREASCHQLRTHAYWLSYKQAPGASAPVGQCS